MGIRNKYNYEEVKRIVDYLGLKLISSEFKNTADKLIIKDKEGYLYFINFNTIKEHKQHSKFGGNKYAIYNINYG